MASERRDICVGRKYQANDGTEKTAWTRIGVLFIKTDETSGEVKISGVLEAAPIGSGNFAAFIPKPRGDGSATPRTPSTAPAKAPSINPDDDKEIRIEDVPF